MPPSLNTTAYYDQWLKVATKGNVIREESLFEDRMKFICRKCHAILTVSPDWCSKDKVDYSVQQFVDIHAHLGGHNDPPKPEPVLPKAVTFDFKPVEYKVLEWGDYPPKTNEFDDGKSWSSIDATTGLPLTPNTNIINVVGGQVQKYPPEGTMTPKQEYYQPRQKYKLMADGRVLLDDPVPSPEPPKPKARGMKIKSGRKFR